MRMETKEMNFKGFKMNGFLALFLFLFMWAGATVWCFVAGGVLLYVLGTVRVVDHPELWLHDAGAQRGTGHGVLRPV